jgi:cardiolipin synthase
VQAALELLRRRFALGGLLALCACVSPQNYGPQVDETAGRSVRIESTKGLLSPAQSAKVIDGLEREGKAGDALQRHIALEEATAGSPLVAGNSVTLLEDGPATYKAMFAAIRAARDHVNLESYIFSDDDVGRRFADLLVETQSRGVQVSIIYDSVGAIKTPKSFWEDLEKKGVRVLEFNPINPLEVRKKWLINNRDHRKLLIVDGHVAFVGGINISNVYSSASSVIRSEAQPGEPQTGWRDLHARIEGPVVADFQKLFLETWRKQKGKPLPARKYFPQPQDAGDALVRAIGATYDQPYSAIYATLLTAVANAQKRIHVTVAYFVPDQQIVKLLAQAARRGVDVTLILPGETDFWPVLEAGRSHYSALLKAGVKIYERRGALLHSKTVVVDEVWSSIGSTNWDPRSFVHNNEVNAEVLGLGFARELEATFQKDLSQSEEIDPEQWRERSPLAHLKEWTARVWEYWL